MSQHARLGPSNARWPHCAGSVREEAAYPDIPGEAAIDGTGTHLLLEMCLENGVRAEAYDGQVIGEGHEDSPMGWFVDLDRIKRVQMALDYLVRRSLELKAEFGEDAFIKIEAESPSNPGQRAGRDDWWGTVDITITVSMDGNLMFIEIIDYKDGRGWVHVSDNTQLQSYLIGKTNEYGESLQVGGRVTIIQPKTKPIIRYEFIEHLDLKEVETRLVAAAAATDDPNAPLTPDNNLGKGHCRWCKHRNNCEALNASLTTGLSIMETTDLNLFSSLETAVATLSDMPAADLAALADTKEAVLKIYEKINTELTLRLERNDEIPGWAMRPGKGSQLWAQSEEETIKALKSRRFTKADMYPSKLVTPAAALKFSKLTDVQRERMKEALIVFKAGADRPTKVSLESQAKPDPATMFLGATAPEEPVSFL